jgi:hypothetical protein
MNERDEDVGTLWRRLNQPRRFNSEPPRSTQEATLWLQKYAPERLDDWLVRHDPGLRQWLEDRAAKKDAA